MMKKSSIVYFSVGCVCLLCVPVMAYIYFPIGFIYLLPAVIFFLFSRDIVILAAKKVTGFFMKVFPLRKKYAKGLPEQFSSLIGKIDTGMANSQVKPEIVKAKLAEQTSVSESPVISAKKVSDVELQSASSAEVYIEELPVGIMEEVPVGELDAGNVSSDVHAATEKSSVANAAKANGKKALADIASEAKADKPYIDSVSETHVDKTPMESISETHVDKAPMESVESRKIQLNKPLAGRATELQKTIVRVPEKMLTDVVAGIKDIFGTVADRVRNINTVGFLGEKSVNSNQGADFVNKKAEIKAEVTEKSVVNTDTGDSIDAIKKQFDELDMITTSAIAIMLSDTRTKAQSPFIKNMIKPDIRTVLMRFCQDTYHATDIEQLNRLFSKSYYKRKVKQYLGKVTVFVKRGIGDSLPRRVSFYRARSTKNTFIDRICETIGTFEAVKYISALSGNEEISDTKRNYKLDHLSDNYKDALIYLVDLLLTCTCISKMLFVERVVKNMDESSEFKKIITNMAQSINNHNIIINKSRPIYKQYYQSELGYINGDDLLYGMAIIIIVNSVRKASATSSAAVSERSNDYRNQQDFRQSMLMWLDGLAKENSTDDVGMLILQRISSSIKGNYGLLINSLQELTSLESYYEGRVAYYEKEKDKERYLKGDFKDEIITIG